jgi:hypothetical protein
MTKPEVDQDWLFRSLSREEFEKLERITEKEIQDALDRGRPSEAINPAMIDAGMFYF